MRTVTIAVAALAATAAFACSGSPTGPSGTGLLNVRITDGPYSDAKALLVTFSNVSAHRSGSGWSDLSFAEGATSRTCDLKKLENGAEDILGSGPIADGHYTQLRVVVSRATLYFDHESEGAACGPHIAPPAGLSAAVTIPSGEVKLNRQFTVPAGGATTILVDFDGDQSVHQSANGSYMMTPVIAVLSVQ